MKTDPEEFPNYRIAATGDLSQRLRKSGLRTLQEVICFVQDLPYGRADRRADYAAVLDEEVGTCSTKHALVARLCEQQGFDDVQLTIGIYEMNERNTPGVGPVITDHGLESIPEAHCYLKYRGDRFDFTRNDAEAEPITHLLFEEAINPSQIGEYKRERHRTFLRDWLESNGLGITLEELWHVRETCIQRLSRSSV